MFGAHVEEAHLDPFGPVADERVVVVQGVLKIASFLVVGDVLERLIPGEFVFAVVEGLVMRLY